MSELLPKPKGLIQPVQNHELKRTVSRRAKAKLNLALHVLGRRSDGYHELDSIVAFADIADIVSIEPADVYSLETTGPFAGKKLPVNDNIVFKACRFLTEHVETGLPPVKITLEKNLPIAAGLGGGSADAAAVIHALVELFDLELTESFEKNIAHKLGADVPVCLFQKLCRVQGIGELIEPITCAFPRFAVLVNPGIETSTAEVFRLLNLAHDETFRSAISDANDFKGWRNDLTSAALKLVPEISEVLGELNASPDVLMAQMSGSGATCFGLTGTQQEAKKLANDLYKRHPDWWVVDTVLS